MLKNCIRHWWKRGSRSGRPVIGISKCVDCGTKATVKDWAEYGDADWNEDEPETENPAVKRGL